MSTIAVNGLTHAIVVADAELVEALADRIPQPIDSFEAAAVIESMGITDGVAADQYGARDVFELAERVYPDLVRVATARLVAGRSLIRPEEQREAEMPVRIASSRGLIAIAPLALLMVLMELLGLAGWTTSQVLSMCFGASLSMLLTAGPILAIGRRTAIYLGYGHANPARRFTAQASFVTMGAAFGVAVAVVALATVFGVASLQERLTFGLSALAFGLLSVLSAALTVARWGWCPPVCAALGIGAGAIVGVLWTPNGGIAVGYAAAALCLTVAWNRVFGGDPLRPLRLPPMGPLLVEAAPYLAFGALFSIFFLQPHLLAWFGTSDGTMLDRLRVFEFSFLLALPPVLLAAGVQEIAMEAFWDYTRRRKWRDGRGGFNEALAGFHRRQTIRYAGVVGAISVVVVAVVEAVVATGVLPEMSQTVFLCSVAAAALMGLGQFNCLFMMSLARPVGALVAALAGIATVTIVGVPLAQLDYELAAAACTAGAAVFAVMAWIGCRQLIGDVDHHYATAF